MEEKTLGGAVNAFEEQFEKFKNSEQEPPVFLNTQREKSVSRIEKKQEKLYHQKIEREYRILLNPDLYYSEHSATLGSAGKIYCSPRVGIFTGLVVF